jgi:hypothetical protein
MRYRDLLVGVLGRLLVVVLVYDGLGCEGCLIGMFAAKYPSCCSQPRRPLRTQGASGTSISEQLVPRPQGFKAQFTGLNFTLIFETGSDNSEDFYQANAQPILFNLKPTFPGCISDPWISYSDFQSIPLSNAFLRDRDALAFFTRVLSTLGSRLATNFSL